MPLLIEGGFSLSKYSIVISKYFVLYTTTGVMN